MGTDTIHHDAAHASCIMLPVQCGRRLTRTLMFDARIAVPYRSYCRFRLGGIFGAAQDVRRKPERAELLLHLGGVARRAEPVDEPRQRILRRLCRRQMPFQLSAS